MIWHQCDNRDLSYRLDQFKKIVTSATRNNHFRSGIIVRSWAESGLTALGRGLN